MDHNDELEALIEGIGGARSISYEILCQATNSFDKSAQIGDGKFGFVYEALLESHHHPRGSRYVAVKKMKSRITEQSKKDFIAEITSIGNLRHRYLVELIGWCYEPAKEQLLIVFELVDNGSLDTHLFSEKYRDSPLSWANRYKIACGLASAIDYLHTGSQSCVIHRDIKPANVMLAKDWAPKLGDFGLARLSDHDESINTTARSGTYGYMAPEIVESGSKPNMKTDVYSFGVVALNIATGRGTHINELEMPMLSWVWGLHANGCILDALDGKLRGQFDKQEAFCLLVVGLWCCNTNPLERPKMEKVVSVLNNIEKLLQDAIQGIKPLEGYFGSCVRLVMNPASNSRQEVQPPAVYNPLLDYRLHAEITNRINNIFSNDTILHTFLRNNSDYMDEGGWVPIHLIANLDQVRELTTDIQVIFDAVSSYSNVVEVQGDKIRKRYSWMSGIMPSSSAQLPTPYGSQYPQMLQEEPAHHVQFDTQATGQARRRLTRCGRIVRW